MKEIQLTQGKLALVDDEDFERINQHKWQAVKWKGTFYASRSIRKPDGARYMLFMHRAVMGTPENMQTDHIECEGPDYGLDNRKSNLRICTRAQNGQNRISYKNSASKYKGVNKRSKGTKWQASIRVDKKLISLGVYHHERDAAQAYNEAALKHFGPFARINKLE